MVMITFIESQIVAAAEREVLFRLNEVRVREAETMDPVNRLRLKAAAENLLRMWARL